MFKAEYDVCHLQDMMPRDSLKLTSQSKGD